MKIIARITCLTLTFLLIGTSCKDKKTEVTPIDSTQILPPGNVDKILITTNAFVDTGAIVTIKGKGFDPNMKNRYFLFVRNEDTNVPNSDVNMSEVFKSGTQIRDSNLIQINDSIITFKLPKYSLVSSNKDSAYLYFTGLKSSEIYTQNDGSKWIHAKIISRKQIANTPIFRMLSDTLYLSKKYDSRNKQIIQGNYYPESIKVVVQNLEYKSTDGYFVRNEDYTAPIALRVTLSMVATQDLFYLPDGSYNFEIYERNGSQRKFIEETGKTKVYIKNVP